jgi:hypothetical protein
VSKLAEDHTPGMSTWAGFPDGPALLFSILEGISNVLVWMFCNRRAFHMLIARVYQL